MTWRPYLLLFLLSLGVLCLVAAFQPAPGYMDADYYFAGGVQLLNGDGFTEPYLWNYLNDPQTLPQPSHAYWMPLASMLAAAGGWLFHSSSWLAGRSLFILVASSVAPLAAALAWSISRRRDLAVISGLLAVCSGFYLPFLPVTDTFGICMFLGGLFFLIVAGRKDWYSPLLLGLIAGGMHLTRADGVLWLLLALLAVGFILPAANKSKITGRLLGLLLVVGGYLVVMLPWFARNMETFGSILSPGGSRMFWLTSYDRLFAYPGSQLTFSSWWESGLAAILRARIWSFGFNLATMVTVQGGIILLPFIVAGCIHLRKDNLVRLASTGWLATLALMTLVFPYAGARGGFFHSGAAFQVFWWALAPIGLERVIQWTARKRNWNVSQASKFFQAAMLVGMVLISAVAFGSRVLPAGAKTGWGKEELAYRQAVGFLVDHGMKKEDVVMVANPPGFYLASGQAAIAVPDENIQTLLEVARKYAAHYLVLEPGAIPKELTTIYENAPVQSFLPYLGEQDAIKFYEIRP